MRKLNFLSMLKKMIIRKDGAHMPMYRHTAKNISCMFVNAAIEARFSDKSKKCLS